MSRLDAVFDAYDHWYRTRYTREMRDPDGEDDDDDDDLGGPFDDLKPVPAAALTRLARTHAIPRTLVSLLGSRGAGVIKAAEEWGQSDFALLRPSEIERARRDCISWLSADAIARARADQRLDVAKLVPFLVMPDGTTWVVLAGASPLDRVFYVSHDWEQRDDVDLFAGPVTLVTFFEHFFSRCRRKDPLNGSYAHRFSFGKARS